MTAMALDHDDERPVPRHLPVPRPPVTRAECGDGPRPCPHSTCRYHLDAEAHSCALDVADLGPQTLDAVGALLGVTKEYVRQIEAMAFRSLRARYGRAYLEEIFERVHPASDGAAADGEPDVDAPRVATPAPPGTPAPPRHRGQGRIQVTEKIVVDYLTQHGPTHRSVLLPLVGGNSALVYVVHRLRKAGVLTGGGGNRCHPIPYRLRSHDDTPDPETP